MDAILRGTPGRIGFSFSLLLLLAAAAFGGPGGTPAESPYTGLAAAMRAARSADAAVELARHSKAVQNDPDLSLIASSALRPNEKTDVLRARLEAALELRALPERAAAGADPTAADVAGAAGAAKEIKSSPFYSDAGVGEGTNWLGNALDRLKNLKWPWQPKPIDSPKMPLFGPWVRYLIWGLLACAVVFLLYIGTRHVEWKRRLARKAKAVLEDDEPERSVDEWLTAADDLAARGEYREAVRALYLACLLRFDEHRVARFDRRETNWEHLYRIRRSDKLPIDIDFTAPTKSFDRIWYGKETDGMADVERFRGWYQAITTSLREGRA